MYKRFQFTLKLLAVFSIFYSAYLNGQSTTLESYKKKETQLSEKRFNQKLWSGKEPSDLTTKTFPFKHWNKHYSSLGTQKWDHTVEKNSDKKRYKTNVLEFSNKDIELSDWQGKLARLESQAQISTDQRVGTIQDKRIYERMLQQAENYNETGELLSLRDINRFQFRKNRPDDEVPVTKAGSESSE